MGETKNAQRLVVGKDMKRNHPQDSGKLKYFESANYFEDKSPPAGLCGQGSRKARNFVPPERLLIFNTGSATCSEAYK